MFETPTNAPYRKEPKNQSNIHTKSYQNLVKIHPKCIPNPPKIHSWSSLGPSWPRLGPSWRQEALKNETRPKNQSSDPPSGPPFWEGFRAMLALCWAMLRSKSAWKAHLVNLDIKACIGHANLAEVGPNLAQLDPT